MGPRYTKAIIMMVVGFPVLVAGFIIDNSIDPETGRSSTVTIARLMIAAGAIMVAIGIFFCCTVTLSKKDDQRCTRPRLTNYSADQPKASTPMQSQLQQPEQATPTSMVTQLPAGIQMVTYSSNPVHNKAYPLGAQHSIAHTINSPSAPMHQVDFVPATSIIQNIDQYPGTSGHQNIGQYSNTPAGQNISQYSSNITKNGTYTVSAADMANFLTAAKKVLDPTAFEELAQTYPIAHCTTQGEHESCPPLSADHVSHPAGHSNHRHSRIENHQHSEESVVEGGSPPSAPLLQGSSPELDPPPYCP